MLTKYFVNIYFVFVTEGIAKGTGTAEIFNQINSGNFEPVVSQERILIFN